METVRFNEGWKFWLDRDSFSLVWNIPEEAKEVTLPHDAMIKTAARAASLNGSSTGFRDGAVYTYVKIFYAPEYFSDRTVTLQFDGVYMNAFVYVNGQLAGKNPFGYTAFHVPLNDYLKYGEDNEIRVQARCGAMPNSRWYSGGGIYRDVWLLTGGMVHVAPEGLQVTAKEADGDLAVLSVSTGLVNRTPIPQAFVQETIVRSEAGEITAADRTPVILLGQEKRTLFRQLTVDTPALWSDVSPNLYTCEVILYKENEAAENEVAMGTMESPVVLDRAETPFGIRTLSVDAKRGLRVNGQRVKLRGGCIHHDSGLLGAATFYEAQYRQIRIMKEAGFNAVRISHHPAAGVLLRACDELGMYVMNEAFDMWNRPKSDYDYGLYFREWWENDITAMVRTSYNHPSVILYSVGNEIPEIGNVHGAKLCQDICAKVKALDPTRFTLSAINGVFASGDAIDEIMADVVSGLKEKGEISGNVNNFMTLMDSHLDDIVVHPAVSRRLERASAGTDIAGYNYMTARYEPDGRTYPNRVIVGSETYPPQIARNWALVERLPYVIGDFTWTGWDYIGEAGVGIPAYHWGEGGFGAAYPAQLAYCGDIDLIGCRRPASYFRQIVFGLRREPYIAVQNPMHYGETLIKTPWVISDAAADWTWPGCEGRPAIVEVYAGGEEVELLQNGTSIGRKPSGSAAGFRTLFETVYEPGTLTAVVYDSGNEIGRSDLTTAGKAAAIRLTVEEGTGCSAVPQELVYIEADLIDVDGQVVPCADQKLILSVEGAAEAVGFGSADPKPTYNFNENATRTFGGRALIILRRKTSGAVRLTVQSEAGLKAGRTLEIG